MAKRIPGPSPEWQNFFLCLFLHLFLPLLPLVLEQWFAGHIETKSAALTATMYALAIGISSINAALFAATVVEGVAFAAAFGYLTVKPDAADNTVFYIGIGLVMVFHGIERFNRHVVDQAPFLDFLQERKG